MKKAAIFIDPDATKNSSYGHFVGWEEKGTISKKR